MYIHVYVYIYIYIYRTCVFVLATVLYGGVCATFVSWRARFWSGTETMRDSGKVNALLRAVKALISCHQVPTSPAQNLASKKNLFQTLFIFSIYRA